MAQSARDGVRSVIRARLQSLDQPSGTLAIVGVGGSGKSVLLAAAAERLAKSGKPVLRTAGRFLEQHQHLAAFEERGDDEVAVRRQLTRQLAGGWLLVDDAQWLDDGSLEVVAALAERSVDSGIGLVVTFRPVPTGERAGLALLEAHASAGQQLFVLEPLDTGETGAMVAGLTGAAADEALTGQVRHLTAGWPLFIERLVQAWLADGVLVGGRLAGEPPARLSEQVTSLVRGRLGLLTGDERIGLIRLSAGLSTSPAVLASLRAAGLLQPTARTPVPLVSAALGQVLGAEAWTEAIGSQGQLQAMDVESLQALATPLAAAGASDPRALVLYGALGDRLRSEDPSEAAVWYREVLRGGGGAADQRLALSESMLALGRSEEALQEAEAVLRHLSADQGDEADDRAAVDNAPSRARARALTVVGAVLAARGLWSDARARYEAAAAAGDRSARVQAAACAAAEGQLPAARILVAERNELEPGGATDTVLGDVAASRVVAALLKSLDPTCGVGEVVRTARVAASLVEGARPRAAEAAGVAELAALLALKADAPATARRLLSHAGPARETAAKRATPAKSDGSAAAGAASRFGVHAPRAALLGGWAALREGDLTAARVALDSIGAHGAVEGPSPTSSTVTLLTLGLRAALLRQSGDLTVGGQLAKQAPALLVGVAVDLWTIEAAGELAVLLHRFGQSRPADALTAAAAALLDGLGHPPLWAVRFHWGNLQVGVATRSVERLAEPVAALRQLADAHPALEHYAAAGALWHDVLAGQVDAGRLSSVLATLTEVGLTWEASELAGQAAIRVDNGALAKSLLSQAREIRAAAVPAGTPGVPDAAGAVTPAGLSERECEVARLVLEGRTHRDIGGQLFISPKTVEHHVAHIRQKLGATTRAEFLAALSEDLAEVDRAV